jgi:hypothetical protein
MDMDRDEVTCFSFSSLPPFVPLFWLGFDFAALNYDVLQFVVRNGGIYTPQTQQQTTLFRHIFNS